jgi:branched-chain amino acid transport system permease protein
LGIISKITGFFLLLVGFLLLNEQMTLINSLIVGRFGTGLAGLDLGGNAAALSLPIAFAAGMGVGVIQQGAFAGSSKPDDAAALMLIVVLGALLFQRQRMARAYDTGVSSFKVLQEFRPVPAELRGLPEVRNARVALAVVVAGLVLAAPWIVGTNRDAFLASAALAAMVAVSLVVLSGWAGQISLGQFGFAGFGAAVAGGLATRHDLDFFLTIGAAAVAGALLAVLVGIPALRVPGLFLAVVTLALAATVQYGILSRAHFSWLLPPTGGYVNRPNLYGRLDVTSDTRFYYVCLVFLALAYASARALRNSRSGRLFIGLRDNQRAAQSYGVNAAATKLAAFAIAGAIAAVAGALFAYQSQVDAGSFQMVTSLTAFLYAVVGGLTSLPGAVGGTVLFTIINHYGGEQLSLLASGVGVAFVLYVFPGGIAQIAFQARDAALRWVADRHHIHVPSLVADRRVEAAADEEDADHVLRAAAEQMNVVGAGAR